jgi:hypothetical protein
MRRIVARLTLVGGAALMLSACAFADSRSPVPEFMRIKAADPPPPEEPPDIKLLVRDKLDSVFMTTSHPREVRVSTPYRDVRGHGWTACVMAEVDSAMGKPLGSQTYRIIIDDGMIIDRRRVGDDDTCVDEKYEPL